MSDQIFELQLEGIPGPTYNYSGLAQGNIASIEHKNQTSSPLKAALQSLVKMKLLFSGRLY